MVTEYAPGISLDEFVHSGGPASIERALGIFQRTPDGIEHAHGSGSMQRHIKPANNLLADNGQVKVMDLAFPCPRPPGTPDATQPGWTHGIDVARADPRG